MRNVSAAVAVLLLAACSGSAGNQQASGNGSAGEASASSTQAGSTGLNLQPGEWEITMTMSGVQATGLPAGVTMPQTALQPVRSCLTAERLRHTNAAIFGGASNRYGMNCDYSGVTVANGRIQGRSTCSGRGMTATATMDGSFTPTSYDIQQQLQTSTQGRESRSTNHLVGRRVGDCSAEELQRSAGGSSQ